MPFLKTMGNSRNSTTTFTTDFLDRNLFRQKCDKNEIKTRRKSLFLRRCIISLTWYTPAQLTQVVLTRFFSCVNGGIWWASLCWPPPPAPAASAGASGCCRLRSGPRTHQLTAPPVALLPAQLHKPVPQAATFFASKITCHHVLLPQENLRWQKC